MNIQLDLSPVIQEASTQQLRGRACFDCQEMQRLDLQQSEAIGSLSFRCL